MSIIKQEYENGVVYVIASGRLTKDPQYKKVGNKNISNTILNISVGYSKDEDGDPKTEYLTCALWRELADFAASFKKGDIVCVMGSLEITEYNGKVYEKASCDFIIPQTFALDELGKTIYKAPPNESDGEDEDIPF